jgi:hypothetical protein
VEILPASLPEEDHICTTWFYADCLADYYEVEPFSDRHFEICENFIKTAVENGINMIFKAPHWVLLSAVITWVPLVMFFWFPALFWGIAIIFIAAWFAAVAFASTLFLKEVLVYLKKAKMEADEEEEEA